ncbi:MAG: PilZ domain-containing protein [Acidobacteria bacterium]|nr:PilZ domain-containing protein [Acidobacteriota bacterium]
MVTSVDLRREPRTHCNGEVRLILNDGAGREIVGQMMDVSFSGFRVSHGDPKLEKGMEVWFSHPIFKGRARVAWTRCVYQRVESGFSVLRDG